MLIAYLSTAIFEVGVREQAIIERFGRPLSLKEPVQSGLHLKLPWPFDRIQKVKVTTIKELNIGNITDRQTSALIWTRKHGTEEPFLSGDNNFFYPYIVLHYRIKNIFNYLYENTDPETLLNEIAHRIVTIIFAKEEFYNIAATSRKGLEKEIYTRLQEEMDTLESGIELLAVSLKDIHPPISIADSFERVIAGHQEKQRIINDALGYKNKALPESRGRAVKELEAAKSYIIEREKKAEGNATRFKLSLPKDNREKQITMSRIYLQTMQEILRENKMDGF
ncbi:MAG: protease modulator HflK [Deltaproteobacteria bacterium]|nr:protease modulator HflK [Deltaproteobacteria bacterium]